MGELMLRLSLPPKGRVVTLLIGLLVAGCTSGRADDTGQSSTIIELLPPREKGRLSFEEVLARRRSVRSFKDTPLTRAEQSQLFWATQGVTEKELRLRTAPSAGALYPLELYLSTADGILRYDAGNHRAHRVTASDVRAALYEGGFRQAAIREAPSVFIVVGVYSRTAKKYGQARTPRYVALEAGHATQNLLLQAAALGLASVPIGAFDDEAVRKALRLPPSHRPLYLVPVGHPALNRCGTGTGRPCARR